ncbi:putative peptidoglycan lipid II flippase [Streptosporangium becharense]|uniref:Putative peptidoglycan lipid II flippase n=1 Tax=Streptosporangium becharense TaxID=1816182 RepID=A0A7W9ID23_9ACTN|nr:lipid II flippase MurJ [Streptosporangium becharense]MBB2915182.1 putative peptidoglycan lipid II flippase [Streptosporangium becharense]MBB5817989.1 putative peptidoglycan lipid II flippase [Streptosporangium becharense]
MIRKIGQGIAGAAILIGAVTVMARAVGFGRYLFQSQSVGNLCLSTAYNTANYVPNIVFELVAGGALAGTVVPVLAAAVSRAEAEPGAREETGWITSALLTWVTLVMVPLALLIAAFAGPIVALLAGDSPQCDVARVVEVGADMLVLFAPRMIFFGLAVVLYGVLQAHRRFMGPALAPLVSSLLIVASYLAFEWVGDGGAEDLADLSGAGELTLSLGATVAAAAMVVTVIGPVARLRLRLRPTLSFPPGIAAQARRLATAGLAVLVAQQIALVVAIVLANDLDGQGAVGVYTYSWALYQLPYAVLVVPVATSSFPVLSTRAAEGDLTGFATLTSSTTRVILLMTGLAAGVMAAVAGPAARVFLEGSEGGAAAEPKMAAAVALFAPGLVGYALMLHLARVLYACGRGRAAATASVAGWAVALVAQILLAHAADDPADVVGRLALGSTVGMTVGGALLALAVFRAGGAAALDGVWRALLAALAGGGAAWGAGAACVAAFGDVSRWVSVPVGGVAALAGTAAFALVAVVVDRPDTRAMLARLRREPARG